MEDEAPEEVPIKRLEASAARDNAITKDVINVETCAQAQEKSPGPQMPSADTQCTDTNVHLNKNSRDSLVERKDKQSREKEKYCKGKTTVNRHKNEKILHKYHNKFLENLLARDIQHERNLICQCMKYIVDNNFFDADGSL